MSTSPEKRPEEVRSLAEWMKGRQFPAMDLHRLTGLSYGTCWTAIEKAKRPGDETPWVGVESALCIERHTGIPWATLVSPKKRPGKK